MQSTDEPLRYGSVSGFIYHDDASPGMVDRYNDLPRALDAWSLDALLACGVDAPLARHVAHLFVRDPLVLFDGLIQEVRRPRPFPTKSHEGDPPPPPCEGRARNESERPPLRACVPF
jgi:hypothetical protein